MPRSYYGGLRSPPEIQRPATYTSTGGIEREIIAVPGSRGSTLVIDRGAETEADARLVGHLAAHEAPENARILCELYMESPDRGRCRRLTQEDLLGVPFVVSGEAVEAAPNS